MMPRVWRLGMHIYHSLQVLSRIILLVPSQCSVLVLLQMILKSWAPYRIC